MKVAPPALAALLTLLPARPAGATPTTRCRGPIRDVSSIAPAYVSPGIGPHLGPAGPVFPCVPAARELQISTTSTRLSANPKADDTATTATCADVLAAADVMRRPNTVLVMRHGTTVMAQATRESYTCKLGATDPDDLPCIAAVAPDPGRSQDEWFVNPNPRDYDVASSTTEAYVGNERNPQRQLDLQGAVESEIVGEALAAAGIEVGEYVSSAYDRCVNSARILKWAAEPDSEEDGVKLYWNVSGQFEKHARVYNLSFSEVDFGSYWADAEGTVPRYPDKNFRTNVWLNYVYRNTITDLAWSNETSYMNIHGLFVLRALNIYNERSVVTVVSANKDKDAPTYSDESTTDSDGNEVPFRLADTDNIRYEFQMAPSAFGALTSCTALAADAGFRSSSRGLFALDADNNFEVSAEEFEDGCAAADPSIRAAIFAALDSEGARFDDDANAMKRMEGLLAKYEVKEGMNYTSHFDDFRAIARTARLPRSLRGDGKVSLGVVQEARHFEPHMNWPYPDRVLRRHAEDLPRSFGDLDALYGPEHALLETACGGDEVPDGVVDAFADDSIVADVYETAGLFSRCGGGGGGGDAPGPAVLTYLFETYSAPNCPEEWQGKFVSRTQTQIPQGFSHERDPDFKFLDHYTGKERVYGDDYKQGLGDVPPLAVGTYKSQKLRLGASLVCEGLLSIEELSMSMCNHNGKKLRAAMGIDELNNVSCETDGSNSDPVPAEPQESDPSSEEDPAGDEKEENDGADVQPGESKEDASEETDGTSESVDGVPSSALSLAMYPVLVVLWFGSAFVFY